MKTVAIIAVMLLAGCASGGALGPDGRALFHIETVGAMAAYKNANEKCPGGYDLLTSRQQGMFFVIDIECR